MKLIAVVTTVGDIDAARRLARDVIERKLAACAQLSMIESFYHWKGTLENEPEVCVFFKTTQARCQALQAAIVELHPYEVPDIHVQELSDVHAPYAAWVAENVARP